MYPLRNLLNTTFNSVNTLLAFLEINFKWEYNDEGNINDGNKLNITILADIHYHIIVWGLKIFCFVFEEVSCSPRLHLFDTVITVILWNNKHNFLYFKMSFINMMAKLISIITPVSSVTWSFRNHYDMLICCSRNITCYYQCWNFFLNL